MTSNKIKLKDFPATFWVGNTLEIFERMAWYGFFAVSSLYITGSLESGGLGFTDEDRGVLQGVVTFFLYLFPVVSGALADRYGFKKTLLAAFIILTPSYYLLGQMKTFPTFFLAFMLVALGAGTFKPVIIGTIAKTTNERTGSMGFGIFYMMVNIGGFLGPIIAGIMRAISWDYVFIASAVWIAINIVLLTLFYKEPVVETEELKQKKLKDVFQGMVEVLGNGRFFLLVFGMLIILVIGSKFTSDDTLSWYQIIAFSIIWLAINLIYDIVLKKSVSKSNSWIFQPLKIGDGKFVLFLLLMSGFWTTFNQIFYTLPLYIRDFTDTSDLFNFLYNFLSSIGLSNIANSLNAGMVTEGQLNPEYIINLNAGAIIVFQVFVSFIVTRLKAFTTIYYGTLITVISMVILVWGTTGFIVAAGILVFSFGEMMASPKSKEYTGRIAPPDKVALYMGYFYWCVALGNLFGGILSGQLYAAFARDMNRPDLMWIVFALIALGTALLIKLYDSKVIKRS